MINLLRFSKASYTIVLLLVTFLTLPAAAQTLTSSEIDAFKAQMDKAQAVYSALGAKVQCYADKDASLQANSEQLQLKAGDLHRDEQRLFGELAQRKHEAEAFRRNLEEARQEMGNLQREMRNIEAQIQAKQAALDDCKRRWYTINIFCDLAGEIVGLNGQLRKQKAQLKAADIKASSLQQQLPEAQSRQRQAAERLQTTQTTLAQTKREIAAAEAEIKVIKASLSDIRTVKQDYSVELLQFQGAFTEFEGLDPSSDRSSVVRRLRRESADLGNRLIKAR